MPQSPWRLSAVASTCCLPSPQSRPWTSTRSLLRLPPRRVSWCLPPPESLDLSCPRRDPPPSSPFLRSLASLAFCLSPPREPRSFAFCSLYSHRLPQIVAAVGGGGHITPVHMVDSLTCRWRWNTTSGLIPCTPMPVIESRTSETSPSSAARWFLPFRLHMPPPSPSAVLVYLSTAFFSIRCNAR